MKANSWFPFWFLSSRPLNVQGQQSKQQNKVLNLFKANKEDFRTTVVLVSLLLVLNRFHTLFRCYYCWFRTSKCGQSLNLLWVNTCSKLSIMILEQGLQINLSTWRLQKKFLLIPLFLTNFRYCSYSNPKEQKVLNVWKIFC